MVNPLLLKVVPYAAILLLSLGVKHCYDSGIRNKAVAAERGRVATAYRDTLKATKDSAVKAYKRDTIHLTKRVVERVTVLKEVEKWLRDTVPVPVEVVKEIIKADSQVIEACQVVRRTCEETNRILRLDLGKSEDETRAARSQITPSFKSNTKLTIAAAFGFALCKYVLCPKP